MGKLSVVQGQGAAAEEEEAEQRASRRRRMEAIRAVSKSRIPTSESGWTNGDNEAVTIEPARRRSFKVVRLFRTDLVKEG